MIARSNNLSEIKLTDYEAMQNLSPEEREAVLAMLKEFGEKGYSEKYNQLLYSQQPV